MNNWGIPDWLEKEVKARDKTCVYCGIQMIEQMPSHGTRKAVATWEHIINDARIVTRENIARCCVACNSSKGTKKLSDWIESSYCKQRGINNNTVADVAKTHCSLASEVAGEVPLPRNHFDGTAPQRDLRRHPNQLTGTRRTDYFSALTVKSWFKVVTLTLLFPFV
jgi:hypothetical protein